MKHRADRTISSLDLLSFYGGRECEYRNVDASRGMSGMRERKPGEKQKSHSRDRESEWWKAKTTGEGAGEKKMKAKGTMEK